MQLDAAWARKLQQVGNVAKYFLTCEKNFITNKIYIMYQAASRMEQMLLQYCSELLFSALFSR